MRCQSCNHAELRSKVGSAPSCVQSLTIAPLALTENACTVSVEPVAAKLPYTWGTVARSCRGVAYGRCAMPAEICAPAPEPDFAQCLARDGDRECPGPYYTVKHVFYSGLADTRDCTPCACGAPLGSTCTAFVSAFKDGSCSSPVVAGTVDATGPVCLDVSPPGSRSGASSRQSPSTRPASARSAAEIRRERPSPQIRQPTVVCRSHA